MELSQVIKGLPSEESLTDKPRPYINHSIELKKKFSAEERAKILESVGLNVFFFPAEMIAGCDLLSDSGTTAMTNEQWASLHFGDESYGSNKGYFALMDSIRETFGKEFFNDRSKPNNAFIFHQGRPSEDALFTMIGKTGTGLVIPSNGHFDTTEANIESNKITALNLFSPDLKNPDSKSKFKGDMDVSKLKELLKKSADKIPLVYLTITNNTGGGQPVSMGNIKEVASVANKYNIPLFFDAARFAENAWFIKTFENGYKNKSVKEIVKEMFSYADGFTASFKKDGLANMGGGLFLRDKGMFVKKYPKIPDALLDYQMVREANPTYGGMSGRDIMALATGLRTVINEDYLTYRIHQVDSFGRKMHKAEIPILMPPGGHALYLDINKFFEGTKMKPEDFGGISLTALLLSAYGHRACELGYFAFGKYDLKTGKETFPDVNFVRFAVPRLRYETQDLDSVVESVKILHEEREKIPGVKVTYGRELQLRHFKARFEFK